MKRSSCHRRPARGFTLIELLVVIAIIGILVALLMPALSKARCVARNGTCMATIADLTRAFEAYESDFGIYPCDPSWGPTGKSNDTKVFVKLLRTKGPRFSTYYNFKEDDLIAEEYISSNDRPFRYTFPAYGVNKGPDNVMHNELPFLLWTYGCLQGAPENEYENNNWSR